MKSRMQFWRIQEGSVLLFFGGILPTAAAASVMAQTNSGVDNNLSNNISHLRGFQVVELRRYTIKEGELDHFVQYFDTYFPEALQQVGNLVFG